MRTDTGYRREYAVEFLVYGRMASWVTIASQPRSIIDPWCGDLCPGMRARGGNVPHVRVSISGQADNRDEHCGHVHRAPWVRVCQFGRVRTVQTTHTCPGQITLTAKSHTLYSNFAEFESMLCALAVKCYLGVQLLYRSRDMSGSMLERSIQMCHTSTETIMQHAHPRVYGVLGRVQ